MGRKRPSNKSVAEAQPPLPVLDTIPVGYMMDSKGRLIPESLIKQHEKKEDALVRRILKFADELSGKIGRFKGRTFEDVASFLDTLGARYGQPSRRGINGKGNITLTSYDGTQRVQVLVADELTFGPSLQVAKQIIDECIAKWSGGAQPELLALVNEAFQVDKSNKVNRTAVFSLLRMEIADPDWKRAMCALRESIRVVGSKSYIRLQRRKADGGWMTISIDIASCSVPEGMTEALSSPKKEGAA